MQARKKQISRLTREERLGALGLQLANGKKLSVGALRGNARIVLVAGTKAQVGSREGGGREGRRRMLPPARQRQ